MDREREHAELVRRLRRHVRTNGCAHQIIIAPTNVRSEQEKNQIKSEKGKMRETSFRFCALSLPTQTTPLSSSFFNKISAYLSRRCKSRSKMTKSNTVCSRFHHQSKSKKIEKQGYGGNKKITQNIQKFDSITQGLGKTPAINYLYPSYPNPRYSILNWIAILIT